MNPNGYRLRPKTEASEYQKRIDQIDTVILCMAEAEKLVANLGKSYVLDLETSTQKTVTVKSTKKPAWEGVDCFRPQKRSQSSMLGRFPQQQSTPVILDAKSRP